MTNKEAKKLSIEHWTRMLDLTVEDIKQEVEDPQSGNCSFCDLYNNSRYFLTDLVNRL